MFSLKSLQQICFSKRPQLTPAPPQGCLRAVHHTRDQDRRPSGAVNILHSPQLPARPEEERSSEAEERMVPAIRIADGFELARLLNEEWVRQKIHPISIIASYGLAMKYLKELLTLKVDYLGEECRITYAKTRTSSKMIGADDDDFFSRKKVKMKMGVQLPSEDSAELERMSDKETDITKERINKIIAPSASF